MESEIRRFSNESLLRQCVELFLELPMILAHQFCARLIASFGYVTALSDFKVATVLSSKSSQSRSTSSVCSASIGEGLIRVG